MTYAVNFETTPRVIAVKLSTGGMMHASFGSVQYVNTGNSWSVAFTSLSGVVVTGVWNESQGRIEF